MKQRVGACAGALRRGGADAAALSLTRRPCTLVDLPPLFHLNPADPLGTAPKSAASMVGQSASASVALLLLAGLACVAPWPAAAQAPPPPADAATPAITATDYKQLALGVGQVCAGVGEASTGCVTCRILTDRGCATCLFIRPAGFHRGLRVRALHVWSTLVAPPADHAIQPQRDGWHCHIASDPVWQQHPGHHVPSRVRL